MSEPVVYDRNPAELELEPGEFWWCSCGRSMTQPFCDGSHEGTGMEPVSFVIEEKTTVLCIPLQPAHPFRRKLPTDSDLNCPPVPRQTAH